MTKLINTLDAVMSAIEALNEALPNHPELADRLGQAHAFYVRDSHSDNPQFGFSKFVGYEGLTPSQYLTQYKDLNGRNTEHVLAKWFEEVRQGTSAYARLYDKLRDWLDQYGKRPRGGEQQTVRIMVIRPEFEEKESDAAEDRRLLDLLIAAADILPTKQRHELRAAL